MRKNFVPEKLNWKRGIRVFIFLMLVGMTATACGFAPNSWRNLFRSEKTISTATIIATKSEEEALSALEESEDEQFTLPPSLTETTKTTKPSLTPNYTASSTLTQTLTYTASSTSTNTYVYIPPTNTQIPPTNTRIPPSNTPVPPSATPKPTDTQITEPPTLEPTEQLTEEPTEKPTEEPTEIPTEETPESLVCYTLSGTHEGEGSNPVASPRNSQGCPTNQYIAGETISLSAEPFFGWEIESWYGTDNNYSVQDTNKITMPAHGHVVKVIYKEESG